MQHPLMPHHRPTLVTTLVRDAVPFLPQPLEIAGGVCCFLLSSVLRLLALSIALCACGGVAAGGIRSTPDSCVDVVVADARRRTSCPVDVSEVVPATSCGADAEPGGMEFPCGRVERASQRSVRVSFCDDALVYLCRARADGCECAPTIESELPLRP